MAEDPDVEERLRRLEERLEALDGRLEALDSDAGAFKIKQRIQASESVSFRTFGILMIILAVLAVLILRVPV